MNLFKQYKYDYIYLNKIILNIILIFNISSAATLSFANSAINGQCGVANGNYYAKAPWNIPSTGEKGLCASGQISSESGKGPWTWMCAGNNGGISSNCAAKQIVAAQCGAANNTPTALAPKLNLCSSGIASSVTKNGNWEWTCSSVGVNSVQQCSALAELQQGAVLNTGSYISNAAQTEIQSLCSTTHAGTFPSESKWQAIVLSQARAATESDNLSPKIDQVRNGVVIASYTSFGSNTQTCKNYTVPNARHPLNLTEYAAKGCGPFGNVSHVDLFRVAQDGDTFMVYPAVYGGSANNIYIAPKPDYYLDRQLHLPNNISIIGVTQNGIKPVILNVRAAGDYASAQAPIYISGNGEDNKFSNHILIENIDLAVDKPVNFQGKAGIYINGASNLMLKQMRVHGFEQASGSVYGANGIFVTKYNAGTLTLDQVELFDNGGASGPAHNIYVNASKSDPNFTLHMLNSWSHDAFYGHTLKSRAPINILENNYFQGGKPQGGIYTQAENYLVDISNGGILSMHNNILVKNASGDNSNGASVTYDVEGLSDDFNPVPRTYSIDIENNTFVAFARTYDGDHPIWPFFFWHDLTPDAANFEVPTKPSGYTVPSATIANNAYVGYCPQTYTPNAYMNYRGDAAVVEAFSELNTDYSLKQSVLSSLVLLPNENHTAALAISNNATLLQDKSMYTLVGASNIAK